MARKKDPTQYYRWQFLRLNQFYQRDYLCYLDRISCPENSEEEKNYFLKEVFEEYGINGLYDPKSKVLPKGCKILGDRDVPVVIGKKERLQEAGIKINHKSNGPYLIDDKNTISAVEITINLDSSNEAIQKELDKLLKEKKLKPILNKYRNRRRYNDGKPFWADIPESKKDPFELISVHRNSRQKRVLSKGYESDPLVLNRLLKIYNLKTGKNMSHKQVGELVYQSEYYKKGTPKSIAKNDWALAKKLVYGGYRNIILSPS